MSSGVKIKREFISRLTGLRLAESNFCYDSCIPQCENNFCMWIKTCTLSVF